jgi:hypothetical protein
VFKPQERFWYPLRRDVLTSSHRVRRLNGAHDDHEFQLIYRHSLSSSGIVQYATDGIVDRGQLVKETLTNKFNRSVVLLLDVEKMYDMFIELCVLSQIHSRTAACSR